MPPQTTQIVLQMVSAVSYLMAAASYGAHVLLRPASVNDSQKHSEATELLAKIGNVTSIIGVVSQTISIGMQCAITHRTPFITPADSVIASAWALTIAFLVLETVLRGKPIQLGAIAMPIAFLCVFAGAVLHRTKPTHVTGYVNPAIIDTSIISLHVIAFLFAFGMMVLSFACAVLYLIQHRMLKQKKSGGLFGKLPPLANIDRLMLTTVAHAFPLLTIGIIAGVISAVAGDMPKGWIADPKIIAAIITWIIYGVYLALHIVAHWRGPKASYLLIGGLLLAILTYFFIPTTVHRFG